MFSVAITVMVFMLIKVVPVFAKMYDGMGVALPTPTAVIMNASNFMRGSGGLTLGLVSFNDLLFLNTQQLKCQQLDTNGMNGS